eukprot:586123-Rhodomonas_salina.1
MEKSEELVMEKGEVCRGLTLWWGRYEAVEGQPSRTRRGCRFGGDASREEAQAREEARALNTRAHAGAASVRSVCLSAHSRALTESDIRIHISRYREFKLLGGVVEGV